MTSNLNSQPTRTGILISFEGGEGVGKSTQIAILEEKLKQQGKDVVMLREPGGTVISEQIREVVLSAKNKNLFPTTEVLLFQAARAQIYSEIVLPALERGSIVLMDRTRDSSVAYQGMVRGFGSDLIEQLNDISTQNTMPVLTLLLDAPVEVGLGRREDSGKIDRLDMEKKDFHQQVRDAYLTLLNEDTVGRWKLIDCTKSIDDVAKNIWQVIQLALK